jgi:hypothetical protein
VSLQAGILHDIVGVTKTALPSSVFSQGEPNHHYSDCIVHVMWWNMEIVIPFLEYLNSHMPLPPITPLYALDHIPTSCGNNLVDILALACLELTAHLICQSHKYITAFMGQGYTKAHAIHKDMMSMLSLMEILRTHSVEAHFTWQHYKNSH